MQEHKNNANSAIGAIIREPTYPLEGPGPRNTTSYWATSFTPTGDNTHSDFSGDLYPCGVWRVPYRIVGLAITATFMCNY